MSYSERHTNLERISSQNGRLLRDLPLGKLNRKEVKT